VQGGQDYFRFVEGTYIIALCLSSLSLFYLLHLVMNITSEVEFYLPLISSFSLGENEEKANTIQPSLLVFFFTFELLWIKEGIIS
jgi:hypothetical protein